MNWARQNPLLAGVVGFAAVATLALGWLIWSASSNLAEVDERYEKQVAEFKRLASLTPFPDAANVAKLEEQRVAFAAAGKALEEQFVAFEPAAATLDPAGFQDLLRKDVAAVIAKARGANVKVADTFYLGFERYRSELPAEKAVPLLARQLAAVRGLMNAFIESGVDAIGGIKRNPVPGETGPGTETAAPATGPAAVAAARRAATVDLITRYPFEVTVNADQVAFRRAVGRLLEQRPLLLLRSLKVKNEKEKGPLRASADPKLAEQSAAATATPAAAGAAAAKPAADALRYVVGQEKLEATMQIEVIRFAAPTAPEKKG